MSQLVGAFFPAFLMRAQARICTVTARHIRIVVAIAWVLICGGLAAALAWQLHWEHGAALAAAQRFQRQRAAEMASDLAALFDREAALGRAFADARGHQSASALSAAGGPALANVVVLRADGSPLAQLKTISENGLPLPAAARAAARHQRVVVRSDGAHRLILLEPLERFADSTQRETALADRIVAVEIDLTPALGAASMARAMLMRPDGEILDVGKGWAAQGAVPAPAEAAASAPIRPLEDRQGRRLIALHPVRGWPVVVGASLSTGEALSSWYALLPLYLFFIFGAAIVGAGLAVVFVRTFERRKRVANAMAAFKARGSGEAKLLIRLADAERRAREAERSKSEFVAHMSHELRTPLNAIIGFSEVIAGGYFGEPGHAKYAEYARDIAFAGQHLHSKIGDVLEFANLEAGRHPIVLQPVDLAAVAREAVDELAGRAFSRRIQLTISLADVGPVRGDRAAVKRVLSNLISNALEYTPEKGAVHISTRLADGAAVVSISDTGQGFTPDEQALAGRAFTRFDRPGATTGIGMGLAIAMALTRAMGGVLRLAGSPGQGTTAELRLLLV